jgi:zinc protease
MTGSIGAPAAVNGLRPTRAVLPNGAVVLVKSTSTTPAVTFNLSVQAGIAYDPPGLSGLAHFASRVIDRGTATRSADSIAEELDSAGVSLAITVNRHVMSLGCTCLSEDFVAVLGLLGEIVMRPTFPVVQVETRRSAIVTAIRQDDDNPAVMAAEGLMALLYGADHAYGRRPRGTVASVAAIDAASLQAFHRRRFVPEAMTLAVVGDVTPGRAVDTATDVFGHWAVSPVEPAELLPPGPALTRRALVLPMMNKAQADIAYGFTTIVRNDPAYYAYWLLNNILGQYALGGRLGDSIRERQGMAYYAMSALDANIIPGPLLIRAGVNPDNVQRALASIDDEVRRMAAEGPTEKELGESRQYLIGSMPRTLESNAHIASFLQTAEFFGLGLDYDARVPELLRAVTREDVLAAARRTLDPSRATVVVAGPYDGTLA